MRAGTFDRALGPEHVEGLPGNDLLFYIEPLDPAWGGTGHAPVNRKIRMMETIEYFQDFLRKIGAPNLLAIGIVVIVIWLLISGIRKGLRKGGRGKGSEDNNEHSRED